MRKTTRAAALLVALVLSLGVMGAAIADKSLTASGAVARLDAARRTVYVTLSSGDEERFAWNAKTRFNGTLALKAKVTIRYEMLSDGQNLAHQITVARN